MTTQMIIAAVIVVGMIIAIMTDKFSFGAPPLVACCLVVLTGVAPISTAFKGFVDTNVIMIAGFMAIMAALQKTSLNAKIKAVLANLATKGGYVGYVLIILVVMLGASLLAGNTGYYVMLLTIAASIPYSKKLPNSKVLMPIGFASMRPLIPVSVAFFLGLSNSLLETAGASTEVPAVSYSVMTFIMSIGFLLWTLVSFKLLPDFDINKGANVDASSMPVETTANVSELPKWKEYCVYAAFLISIVGMMFGSNLGLGEIAYIIPCVATAILCLIGVYSFKEARNSLFSPIILMMAGVIGVVAALADTGFTAMIGNAIAGVLGSSVSPFWLILCFCVLTSACATLTGASIGSLFVFAPIAIATCMSLGINPAPCAAAMTASAWGGYFLPIDGMPAMVLGMGKYKLSQFLKYAVPMYVIQMFALALGAVIAFPM